MSPIDEFVPSAEMLNAKTFPIGMEFNPTGEQLIEAYLLPWAKGEKLGWNGIVEKQMYGENSPCEPWKVFSDIESAFHSKTEEKGAIRFRASNSKRVSRRAGKGTWDGQTGPRKIQNSETGCIIGLSKMLAYNNLSGEADVGHWTVHEYCLNGESVKKSVRSNAADFVVCKVTKTVKKKPSDGIRAAEAHVPVPVPMKRVAEVDLLRNGEDSDMKRLKFDGGEFSGARPDWMKEYRDMFPSEFHQLMEAETLLSPANEAPFANPGVVPTLEPYYGGYEALPVPVPVPASQTVSMKRAAEVDRLNDEDSDPLFDLKQLEDMLGF